MWILEQTNLVWFTLAQGSINIESVSGIFFGCFRDFHVPIWFLLTLTLKRYQNPFLTPKKCDEQPGPLYVGVPKYFLNHVCFLTLVACLHNAQGGSWKSYRPDAYC